MDGFQEAVLRVARATTQRRDLDEVLATVAEGAVAELDAALARVWLIGPGDSCGTCQLAGECKDQSRCLHLRVSRGLTTNTEGGHRRVPIGARKIGLIAGARTPFLTSDVRNDPRVPDKAWVNENDLRSFAGYPLEFDGRLVGVFAMFSPLELADASLESVGLLASQSAVAIENSRLVAELQRQKQALATIIDGIEAAVLLIAQSGEIKMANPAARSLFGDSLVGRTAKTGLSARPELAEAVAGCRPARVSDASGSSYHVAVQGVELGDEPHVVTSIHDVSKEVARHELATWRKALRVINHELRNSISPISTLARTGRQMVGRAGSEDKLRRAFDVIAERAQHLREFLDSYTRFARLAQPRPERIAWKPYLERLQALSVFELEVSPNCKTGWADPTQLEQVIINLVKNAHEACGDGAHVVVRVEGEDEGALVAVTDDGPGLSKELLVTALLPHVSTKDGGTGLGLALCREVIEAHGGTITLHNRDGGGLEVLLRLPGRPG